MNKYDPGGPEAKIEYGDNDFTIVKPGNFVRCAVSGEPVPLDELRYWSVDLQEGYRGPEEAMKRWKETQSAGAKA